MHLANAYSSSPQIPGLFQIGLIEVKLIFMLHGRGFISTKTNAGNQKGLCLSMLVPILITHNTETSFIYM